MTTILGVQRQWGVEIAADSQVNWGDRPTVAFGINKIVRKNGYLLAAAGESRLTDPICYEWKPPKIVVSGDVHTFVVTKVVPSLRKFFTDQNIDYKSAEFELLLAARGELFSIASDLSVIKDELGIYGIGTGGQYAVGAMYAGAEPEGAVLIALRLDINSGGPVQIEKQVKNG